MVHFCLFLQRLQQIFLNASIFLFLPSSFKESLNVWAKKISREQISMTCSFCNFLVWTACPLNNSLFWFVLTGWRQKLTVLLGSLLVGWGCWLVTSPAGPLTCDMLCRQINGVRLRVLMITCLYQIAHTASDCCIFQEDDKAPSTLKD